MALDLRTRRAVPTAVALLIAVQVICAAFFLADVVADYRQMGLHAATQSHLYIEMAATVSLCAAILLELRFVTHLLRRQARLERSASIASAAMHEVIEAHFRAWGLTPAEQDIATFLVKGLSIAEIAQLRGSAEGTVKSHLNAIYRKAGARGRGELLSAIIESVMDGAPTADRPEAAAARIGDPVGEAAR